LGAHGCHGKGLSQLAGRGVAADPAAAFASFERACLLSLPVACFNAGVMANVGLGVPADRPRAQRLLKDACALGFEAACEAR